MAYRPPGRSNRSGRATANDDIFEGLPVKQWSQTHAHISLAPPKTEAEKVEDDKWGDPPMPRDYQLLNPWTQQLLRLARSGKVGTKRKPAGADLDLDEERPEEDEAETGKAPGLQDRGFEARKWRQVPEALLEPEHKHFEFLAKRRKGLPSLYAPQAQTGAAVLMRKTKVQKVNPESGETTVYEVLVPEGQTVEGEILDPAAEVTATTAAPGTVIEGVGIANEEGIVVAEHLKSAVPKRNRPPPKKKGGPGRGKKRVTFTNPDGSTYTKIVPNATKIVAQPGQTFKHVAKGEEATADVTAEQAAANAATNEGEGEGGHEGEEGEGEEGSDEGEDDGDDDEDREEGELSEDDAPTAGVTPVPAEKKSAPPEANGEVKAEDATMTDAPAPAEEASEAAPAKGRDASSSPELPLAKTSHSRNTSQANIPVISTETAEDEAAGPGGEAAPEAMEDIGAPVADAGADAVKAETMEPAEAPAAVEEDEAAPSIETKDTEMASEANVAPAEELSTAAEEQPEAPPAETLDEEPEVQKFEDGDEDLLGNLEKSLEGSGEAQAEAKKEEKREAED